MCDKNRCAERKRGSHEEDNINTDEAWDVIVKKAKKLTEGCTTDMQKAKAISKWIDNTYSETNLNYFDCGIAGFAASDHRCDKLNLEYLDDLM